MTQRSIPLILLILKACFYLLRVEIMIRFGTIQTIYKRVRLSHTELRPLGTQHLLDTLSRAMDIACAFYPRRVLCLQRSTALLFLLRQNGWNAKLIIGAQIIPFRSHAWVELDGNVVGEKSYMREMYQVLECL